MERSIYYARRCLPVTHRNPRYPHRHASPPGRDVIRGRPGEFVLSRGYDVFQSYTSSCSRIYAIMPTVAPFFFFLVSATGVFAAMFITRRLRPPATIRHASANTISGEGYSAAALLTCPNAPYRFAPAPSPRSFPRHAMPRASLNYAMPEAISDSARKEGQHTVYSLSAAPPPPPRPVPASDHFASLP